MIGLRLASASHVDDSILDVGIEQPNLEDWYVRIAGDLPIGDGSHRARARSPELAANTSFSSSSNCGVSPK